MNWHNYSRVIPAGSHAMFSASNYHWIDYDLEKAISYAKSSKAKELGTKLHAFAANAISLRQPLSGKGTIARYVNDAIKFGMDTEVLLYYSPYFFGTADSIVIDRKGKVRIHDLKTGVNPASMKQLYVYDALYCLDYHVEPKDVAHELRIYQNDEIYIDNPDPDLIHGIMDKMVLIDKELDNLAKNGELI